MLDSNKYDKVLLEAYKDRLCYNNLPYHIILLSLGVMYEYNHTTNKIRPFNSVRWYNVLEPPDGEDFVLYLDYKIDSIINNPRIVTEEFFSIMDSTTIIIDLVKLPVDDIPTIYSFNKFLTYIKNLYGINNALERLKWRRYEEINEALKKSLNKDR